MISTCGCCNLSKTKTNGHETDTILNDIKWGMNRFDIDTVKYVVGETTYTLSKNDILKIINYPFVPSKVVRKNTGFSYVIFNYPNSFESVNELQNFVTFSETVSKGIVKAKVTERNIGGKRVYICQRILMTSLSGFYRNVDLAIYVFDEREEVFPSLNLFMYVTSDYLKSYQWTIKQEEPNEPLKIYSGKLFITVYNVE